MPNKSKYHLIIFKNNNYLETVKNQKMLLNFLFNAQFILSFYDLIS